MTHVMISVWMYCIPVLILPTFYLCPGSLLGIQETAVVLQYQYYCIGKLRLNETLFDDKI